MSREYNVRATTQLEEEKCCCREKNACDLLDMKDLKCKLVDFPFQKHFNVGQDFSRPLRFVLSGAFKMHVWWIRNS